MAAPKDEIICTKALQKSISSHQHPQNRLWGPTTDGSGFKITVSGNKLAFFVHFWAKKCGFLVIAVIESANIAVLGLFWHPRALTLSKGHAHSQIVACQASPSTGNTFHQLEIIPKGDRITVLNIYVFKSANIAVLSLLLHPPDRNLE